MTDQQIRKALAEIDPQLAISWELYQKLIKNWAEPSSHVLAMIDALRLLAKCWNALGEIEQEALITKDPIEARETIVAIARKARTK